MLVLLRDAGLPRFTAMAAFIGPWRSPLEPLKMVNTPVDVWKVGKWQVRDRETTRTFLWREVTHKEPGKKAEITQKKSRYLLIYCSTEHKASLKYSNDGLISSVLSWLSIKARREERTTVAYLWLIIRAVDRMLSKQTEFTISLDIKA